MIALDPSQTFDFSLDTELRRAKKTVFKCRFPTARQREEIRRLAIDDVVAKPDEEKALLLQAIKITLQSMTPGAGPLVFSLDIDAGADGPVYTANTLNPEQVSEVRRLAATGTVDDLIRAAGMCVAADAAIFENATASELNEMISKTLLLNRLSVAKSMDDLESAELWAIVLNILNLSALTENERKKSALQSAAAASRRSRL